MSQTRTKRSWNDAITDIHALMDNIDFDASCVQWNVAGSVRRRCPEVSDIEIVFMPRFGDVASSDLFSTPRKVNLLWHRLEELISIGVIEKAKYGDIQNNRWGDKYRGVLFRDFKFEFFIADHDNWGPQLAIRTGPAEFSKKLVTGLLRHGYKKDGG